VRAITDENWPEIPKSVGSRLKELIERCWKPDPQDRPSFDQIFFDLKKMRYRLFDDVDSGGLERFANETLRWQSGHQPE
jgi:hypothetical protein